MVVRTFLVVFGDSRPLRYRVLARLIAHQKADEPRRSRTPEKQRKKKGHKSTLSFWSAFGDSLLSSLPIVVPSKTTQSIACFFRPLHFFGSLYPPLVALASSTEKQSTGLFSCLWQARSLCSLAPNSNPLQPSLNKKTTIIKHKVRL